MPVYCSLPSKISRSKYNIICNSSDKTIKWLHGAAASLSQAMDVVAIWCIDTNLISLFPSLEGIQ